LHMPAAFGSAVRQDRAAAAPDFVLNLCLGDGLSSLVLAGQRRVVLTAVDGRTLVFGDLWRLQRRNGGIPYRNHAGEGSNGGILAGLQSGHWNFWRLHAGGINL